MPLRNGEISAAMIRMQVGIGDEANSLSRPQRGGEQGECLFGMRYVACVDQYCTLVGSGAMQQDIVG